MISAITCGPDITVISESSKLVVKVELITDRGTDVGGGESMHTWFISAAIKGWSVQCILSEVVCREFVGHFFSKGLQCIGHQEHSETAKRTPV